MKLQLEILIKENANKNLPIVFDFDNTLLSRDIGEATFAQMVANGTLTKQSIPTGISLSFTLNAGQGEISVNNSIDNTNYDLTSYYEDFLSATIHQGGERSPYSNGYAWVVQIMSGISPAKVIEQTQLAYANGAAED